MNEYQGYGAAGAAHATSNNYAGNLSGSLVTPELLHSFVVEVKGYLPRIESGLAEYFSYPNAVERLAEAHGYAHTIKKAAHVIGMTALANIAERLESLLEKLATGVIPHNLQTAYGFHQIVTQLGIYLDHSAVGGTVPPTELIEAIYLIENPGAAKADAPAVAPAPVESVSPPQLYVLSEEFAACASTPGIEEAAQEPTTYFAEPTIHARNSGHLTQPSAGTHSEPQPIKADLPPVYVLTHTVSVETPKSAAPVEPAQFVTAEVMDEPLTSLPEAPQNSVDIAAAPYSITQQLPSLPPYAEGSFASTAIQPEPTSAPLPATWAYDIQPSAKSAWETEPVRTQETEFVRATENTATETLVDYATPSLEQLPAQTYSYMEPLRTTQEFPVIRFDQMNFAEVEQHLGAFAPAPEIVTDAPAVAPTLTADATALEESATDPVEIPSPPPPPPFPVNASVAEAAKLASLVEKQLTVEDALPTQPLAPLPAPYGQEVTELPIEPLFVSAELPVLQESRLPSRLAERLSDNLSPDNKAGDLASSGSLSGGTSGHYSRSDWATRYGQFDTTSSAPAAVTPEISASASTIEPISESIVEPVTEFIVEPIAEIGSEPLSTSVAGSFIASIGEPMNTSLASSEMWDEAPLAAVASAPEPVPVAEPNLDAQSEPYTAVESVISWEGSERARTPFDATTVWEQPQVDLQLPDAVAPEAFANALAQAAPSPEAPVQPEEELSFASTMPLPLPEAESEVAPIIETPAAFAPVPASNESAPTISPFAELLAQLSPIEDTSRLSPLGMPAQEIPAPLAMDVFAADFASSSLAERADDFLELDSEDDFGQSSQPQTAPAAATEWEVPAELLEVFLPEAEEHLTVITTMLPKLAAQPDHKGMLQEIRRSAHSLKGSSAVVGFHGITKLAHRMEDMLDLLYEGEISLTPDKLDLLFSSTEALENLLNSKSEPEMIGSLYAEYDRILNAQVESIASPQETPSVSEMASVPVADPSAEESSWSDTFNPASPFRQLTPLPSFTAALSESLAQRALALAEEQTPAPVAEPIVEPLTPPVIEPDAPLAASPEPVATPPELPAITTPFAPAPALPVAPAAQAEKDALSAQAGLINRGNYVRVPIERLDSVVKLVTELIVNRATLEQNMGQFVRQLEELRGNAQRLSRVANRMEVQYEASTLGSGLQGVKTGGVSFANALNTPANGGALKAMLASPVVTQNNYGFDALEFDRYTEFHLLLRELTECSGDMQTMERELRTIREYFESALNRQGRLNSEMQDQLMRLRMVPLATLSSRLHRTAHQVAQQRNKQVNFIIEGEDTRLDKTVIEEMADPLLHILRNAIDHGIETAAVRQAMNKPAQGTVKLRAYHEGTQTVIQISDDGGGLNPERLIAKAIQTGVVTAADATKLTEEEIFALIFIPGFSTAAEISEISGRGVGMDIVKTTIQRLKGRIHLDSKVGVGTVCTIRLPMTLAVMRALLVKACKQTFAIPPVGLQQIIKLTPQMLDRVGEQQVVRTNNKLYPLMQLGRLLNLKRQTAPEGTQLALLMNLEDRQFAIAVDETLGGRDVVVKNLGNHIREVRGITGTTLMGDGSAVLILNLPELVRDALRPASPLTARLSGQQPIIQRPRVRTPAEQRGPLGIMIVDDSLSVRRVLANRLTSVGWKAMQAKDGLDALEQLQHNPLLPDVILLDIEMPRMDGYEFLSALRKNAAYKDIPVVMITSRAGQKHRDRAFEAGANEYLVKPYQDDELLTLIRKLARDEHAE